MDDLDQGDRREQLVAALGRLPLKRLRTRESIGVCTAYLGMLDRNIELLRVELKAAHRSHRLPLPKSHFPPLPPGKSRDHQSGTRDA